VDRNRTELSQHNDRTAEERLDTLIQGFPSGLNSSSRLNSGGGFAASYAAATEVLRAVVANIVGANT